MVRLRRILCPDNDSSWLVEDWPDLRGSSRTNPSTATQEFRDSGNSVQLSTRVGLWMDIQVQLCPEMPSSGYSAPEHSPRSLSGWLGPRRSRVLSQLDLVFREHVFVSPAVTARLQEQTFSRPAALRSAVPVALAASEPRGHHAISCVCASVASHSCLMNTQP